MHVLDSLHWLPVEYRVQYKLVVTTFKVLETQEPSYLSELIRFHTPSSHFRSSGCNRLQQDRVKLEFAERAFCHAAPAVWNTLPQSITPIVSCFTSFGRLLEAEYFNHINKTNLLARTCNSSQMWMTLTCVTNYAKISITSRSIPVYKLTQCFTAKYIWFVNSRVNNNTRFKPSDASWVLLRSVVQWRVHIFSLPVLSCPELWSSSTASIPRCTCLAPRVF